MSLKTLPTLSEIYAMIPKIDCQRKCQESCGPIDLFPVERRNVGSMKFKGIKETLHHLLNKHTDDQDGCITCPQLRDGKCSIYTKRPMICRLWGVVEEMKCPFGCIPERYLTKPEVDYIFAALRSLK